MPEQQIIDLDHVYGVSRDLPLNYVERTYVDGEFSRSIRKNSHLVIYGSSKQGKTSLRKRGLHDEDYLLVSCLNKMNLQKLHESILKRAGFKTELSSQKTAGNEWKIRARMEMSAQADIKVANINGKIAGEGAVTASESEIRDFVELELDPEDPNDVIKALEQAHAPQYIVLEDFHYLPEETQRDFSFSLKTLFENSSFVFIIVGVWRDKNRLIQYNGDLTGRITSINADEWHTDDLYKVIESGEKLLNVKFSPSFKDGLVSGCYNSVYVVQEACRKACQDANISQTVSGPAKEITADPDYAIREAISSHSTRYEGFLMRVPEGFKNTELEMYRYILFPIIKTSAEQLERGLPLKEVRALVSQVHPRKTELNAGNVTQALKSLASLQIQHEITPMVLDYDESSRNLSVVDRAFLIWKQHQDEDYLLDLAGISS